MSPKLQLLQLTSLIAVALCTANYATGYHRNQQRYGYNYGQRNNYNGQNFVQQVDSPARARYAGGYAGDNQYAPYMSAISYQPVDDYVPSPLDMHAYESLVRSNNTHVDTFNGSGVGSGDRRDNNAGCNSGDDRTTNTGKNSGDDVWMNTGFGSGYSNTNNFGYNSGDYKVVNNGTWSGNDRNNFNGTDRGLNVTAFAAQVGSIVSGSGSGIAAADGLQLRDVGRSN